MQMTGSSSNAMLNLAERLFEQVRVFGQFASALGKGKFDLSGSFLERLQFIRAYLVFLEEAADLRFSEGQGPLLYNTKNWSGVPAGYIHSESIPRPSQLLDSYVGTWLLAKDESSSAAIRFIRAALWVCHHRGLGAALQYLCDLQISGFVLRRDDLAQALWIIIGAKTSGQSEREISRVFFRDRVPMDSADWITAELELPDPSKTRSVGDSEDNLLLLVETAFSAVDRVVNAQSYDRWFPGQLALYGLLVPILGIINQYLPEAPAAIKAAIDQLEEMKADSGGMALGLSAGYHNGYRLKGLRAIFDISKIMLSGRLSDDWKLRIMQERAVIPETIKDFIFNQDYENLPEEWVRLSPGFAAVFAASCGDSEPPLERSRRFSEEEIRKSQRPTEAFTKTGSDNPLVLEALIQLTANAGWWPAAESVAPDSMALGVWQPLLSWLDNNRENLEQLAASTYHSMCIDELEQALSISSEPNQARKRIVKLREMRALYPYVHFLPYELGIAEDEGGSPPTALTCIQESILDFPAEWMRWSSLGVVLRRLGHEHDARLAASVSFMIKDRASPR